LQLLAHGAPQMTLCPQTEDPDVARTRLRQLPPVGVEGVVIKGRDSRYRPGQRGWAKLRTRHTHRGDPRRYHRQPRRPHSLLVGWLDATGRLRYVGHTTPLPPPRRRELALLLRDLPEPMVDHPRPAPLPAAWTGQFGNAQPLAYQQVSPELVVEISADSAYEHGRWRHRPRFLRARSDLTTMQVPHR
jgi:ATP-dependent DNA ligase